MARIGIRARLGNFTGPLLVVERRDENGLLLGVLKGDDGHGSQPCNVPYTTVDITR